MFFTFKKKINIINICTSYICNISIPFNTLITKNRFIYHYSEIIYNSLEIISTKTEENPVLVLEKAVKNVTPRAEVKARRVGGSTYQVPIEIRAYRGINIALKWITEFASARSGKSMAIKLSNEIIDAAKETGNSVKRKEQTHKMADANKAFAHFRY